MSNESREAPSEAGTTIDPDEVRLDPVRIINGILGELGELSATDRSLLAAALGESESRRIAAVRRAIERRVSTPAVLDKHDG